MPGLFEYSVSSTQYLTLMLLFGIPLFAWYSPAVSTNNADQHSHLFPLQAISRALLACALLGLALLAAEIAHNTASIIGLAVSELHWDEVTWYLSHTRAGLAGLTRAFLLTMLIALLGWHLWRREYPFPVGRVNVLAGGALLTLAWNGHAAGGEGVSGTVRLLAGIAHLLAASGWIGAIAALLLLSLRCGTSSAARSFHLLWLALHSFSRPGTIFVGVLVVTGTLHYGDLSGWSIAPLFQTQHGNLILLKLALFAAMLGLATLHRWWLVPRLERRIHAGTHHGLTYCLKVSIAMEATIAVLIVLSVAVLGTLNPY